jgi:hypothetical protein
MSAISGVSSAAVTAYPIAQYATKPAVPAVPKPAPAPTSSGTDSDGDNDGSGALDVTG